MKDNIPTSKIPPVFPTVPNRFLDKFAEKSVSPAASWVYLCLLSHSNGRGRVSKPGTERLAKLCNCSRRHIHRLIDELETAGLVTILKRPGVVNKYSFIKLLTSDTQSTGDADVTSDTQVHKPVTPRSATSDTQVTRTIQRTIQGTIQSPDAPKKPRKPKELKPKTTIEQRTAWLIDPDLAKYKRNTRGVTSIWVDAYHVASKHPPRKLSADENGQLRNIWADALASANDNPEKAIRLAKQAIKQAWVDYKAQDKWRAKEPPTPAGVHRHWNVLIAPNAKAEIPPKPARYSQEEWFKKPKEERDKIDKYREDWYEKYGTDDD